MKGKKKRGDGGVVLPQSLPAAEAGNTRDVSSAPKLLLENPLRKDSARGNPSLQKKMQLDTRG